MIIGIVAITKNFAIGRDGKLPWHYTVDLKFFKETTIGHTVVMGARTWRSIGRPLPNRTNVVLSRSDQLVLPESVKLARTKGEALMRESTGDADADTFIIGGREIFALFADDIDRWIITEVPMAIDDADTFMPADFLDDFALESTHDLGDGLTVKFYNRLPQN
ncbi:MAG TPA: dihydrofolate reductase [Pyrinomonadaceae bacterium]